MKELRSFRDVIETRFDKEVWAAVSDYIADNPNSLDVRSYRVQEADEAELADLTVKRVDVRDAAGEGIRFDIIAEAEIVMSSRYHSDVETDDVSQWFRLLRQVCGEAHNAQSVSDGTSRRQHDVPRSKDVGRRSFPERRV